MPFKIIFENNGKIEKGEMIVDSFEETIDKMEEKRKEGYKKVSLQRISEKEKQQWLSRQPKPHYLHSSPYPPPYFEGY